MNGLKAPELLYPDIIARNAKYFHKKKAVICEDRSLTWSEFHLRTNKVANALIALGVGKGDKVCLLMQNSIEYFELLWGTIKAGGVTVPVNTMLAAESVALLINNSQARHVFCDTTTVERVLSIRAQLQNVSGGGLFGVAALGNGVRDASSLIEAASDADVDIDIHMSDSMNIIYSSGTTGIPKGIEHTHFARHIYPLSVGPTLLVDEDSVAVCSTPLYTNGTWIMMLPTVYSGGTVVLLKSFSPENFLGAVQSHRVTHGFMVPTQFIVILSSPDLEKYDTSSLRVLLTGGQAMPSKTAQEVARHLPTAGLYEMYGMTEGFLTIARPSDAERGKKGSVGVPIFGGDVCIIDDAGNVLPTGELGEIAGWSPGLMKGYFRDEKRTSEIVWKGPRGHTYLRSGDVGKVDEDGYIYVSGRVKDMIKSGGINVFAVDIEEVFMQHPDVGEAAAIGIPHDKWGETPLLLAIMKPGSKTTEAELAEWGNAKLGKYQRISRVEFRTEFPRAAHDKVLKRALRDPYWAGRERSI